ncbi:MAG: hypothetical protein O9283_05230 [Sphingomonadaceae bacterium]|nr:hypothetical protein [Sphingomonadaceae bacterium]
MGLTQGSRTAVSLPQAFIRALATAALTGLFALMLLPVIMVISDPTELRDASLDDLPEMIAVLFIGAIWAVPIATLVAWLPITVVGWTLHHAARRWAVLASGWVHAAVGAVCGAIVHAVLDLDRDRTDPAMLAYFATTGIFAALMFRRLTRGAPAATFGQD